MSQDPKLALPRSYQSINKYDGKDRDPSLFKLWDLQVSGHYKAWDHGSFPVGTWAEHLIDNGVYIDEPSLILDERVLLRFKPHLHHSNLNAGRAADGRRPLP